MNCHKSIAEVSDTATPEYSKAFMMQKSKSRLLMDATNQNILVNRACEMGSYS
jgi:hypothetical protein